MVYATHMTEWAAHWLLAHASQVDVYCLSGLQLGAYPQIVVIGRKRGSVLEDVSGEEVLALARSCQNPDILSELNVLDEPVYRLPEPASVRRFHFHLDAIIPDLIFPTLEQYGAHLTNSFQAMVEAPSPPPPLTRPGLETGTN